MKYLMKFNENKDICTTCDGTGEVDVEINMWGGIGKEKCDDCNGSGKGSIQSSNIELKKFIDEVKEEFISILGKDRDKYDDLRYGGVQTEVVRYSDDENDDVETIKIKTRIYSSRNVERSGHFLDKKFFDKIAETYIDYNLDLDAYDNLTLTVYKVY